MRNVTALLSLQHDRTQCYPFLYLSLHFHSETAGLEPTKESLMPVEYLVDGEAT